MKDFINKINNKEDLTLNEMQDAINLIMSGMSDDEDIESFLIGLNEKGVSETEVTAAAIVMKEKSLKFDIGDGSHIDTAIAIRTAVIRDNKIHVGAGAGIVADSDPEKEWEECIQKSKVFLDAMEMIS